MYTNEWRNPNPTPDLIFFLWVDGVPLAPEFEQFGKIFRLGSGIGTDYMFRDPQDAFDAAEEMRQRRQPFEVTLSSGGRYPWRRGSRFMTD